MRGEPLRAVGQGDDVLGVPVGVGGADGDRLLLSALADQALPPRRVDADHLGRGAPVEQARLGREVVLHVGVEVEVLRREVGERADREPGAGDATEAQRVARDLHGDVRGALVDHRREQGLQVGRLGRREAHWAADARPGGSRRCRSARCSPRPPRARPRAGRRSSSCRWCRSRRGRRGASTGRRRSVPRRARSRHGGRGARGRGRRRSRSAGRSAPSASVRTAAAPRASASPAKSAPWARLPGRAAKRSPGRTSCARSVAPVSRASPSPTISTEPVSRSRATTSVTVTGVTRRGRRGPSSRPAPAAPAVLSPPRPGAGPGASSVVLGGAAGTVAKATHRLRGPSAGPVACSGSAGLTAA